MRMKLIFWTIVLFLLPMLVNAALSDNLIVYMHFDNNGVGEGDGTNIRDYSVDVNSQDTKENDGEPLNSPTFDSVEKKLGAGSYYLSETTPSDSIKIIDNDTFDFKSNMTICVWANPDSIQEDGGLIMKTASGTGDEFRLFVHLNGVITVVAAGGGGNSPTGVYTADSFQLICMVYNGSQPTDAKKLRIYHNNTNYTIDFSAGSPGISITNTTQDIYIGHFFNLAGRYFTGNVDELAIWTRTLSVSDLSDYWNNGAGTTIGGGGPDTTPPAINQNSYNMTSEGGAGCVNWRTNPATPCSTGDTTPTVEFTTDENAWCAIGIQSINFTQYVNLGVDRNCTIGQGTSSHTCTLVPDDELTFANPNIYIGCRDSSGNENMTGKSTSGPLSLTITGLEAGGDSAIGKGVQNALLSGYTNYTNQQIYARKLDGTQDFGTFDWMAKKGSKVWAFNYITSGEQHVGMFNLTPVLYVLEMSNITNSTIINKVELMINATK